MWKNVFYVLLWLSNNAPLEKSTIFCWFCFSRVVQKQTLGAVGNQWSFDGQLCPKYSCQKLLKSVV